MNPVEHAIVELLKEMPGKTTRTIAYLLDLEDTTYVRNVLDVLRGVNVLVLDGGKWYVSGHEGA